PGTGKGKERDRPELLIPTSTGITHSSSASSAVSESRSATEMRNDRLARLTNGTPKASPSSIPGSSDGGERDRYREPREPYSAGPASRGESDRILPSGTSSSSRNLPIRPVASMDASPDRPSRTAPPPLRSYPASGRLTSADTLVQAASSLNALLPANLDKATFAHVDAMVGEDGGVGDDSDLWPSKSADLQKGVKVRDEIIRTMTAFLSDMGEAIKFSATGAGAVWLTSSGTFPNAIMVTSPQTDSSGATATMVASNSHLHSSHLRAKSLDEEALSMQRELGHNRNAGRSRDSGKGSETSSNNGRSRLVGQSVDVTSSGAHSKSREQPTSGTRDPISRISDVTEMGEERRAGRVASGSRSSAGGSANGRERLERDHETPPALTSRGAKAMSGAVTGVRRLFSTRRPQTSPAVTRSDLAVRTRAMDDRGSPEDDYSPTPAARNGLANGNFPSTASTRRFPLLAIPPLLSTVPSAANVQRTSTTRFPTASASSPSGSNGVSRRGGGARFPALTSPSKPTTQITTATVSTASEWDSPPSRPQMPDRQHTQINVANGNNTSHGTEREQRRRTLSTRSTSDALPDVRRTSNARDDEPEHGQGNGVTSSTSSSSSRRYVRRLYGTVRDVFR
ncbi:hypothetical protein FRB98_003403, partial [Tulasnella sp. 332]